MALKDYISSVRGVSASCEDDELRRNIISDARQVLENTGSLLANVKTYCADPSNESNYEQFVSSAKCVSQSLSKSFENQPSKKGIDDALQIIHESKDKLHASSSSPPSKSYGELQNDLNQAASKLNNSSYELALSTSQDSYKLGLATKNFLEAYTTLLQIGKEINNASVEDEEMEKILHSLDDITSASSELLVMAKTVTSDPNVQNPWNKMQAAARLVSDSINGLVDVCISAAPSQKQCENGIRKISSLSPILKGKLIEPINEATYFECTDNILRLSEDINNKLEELDRPDKVIEQASLEESVKDVSKALCSLLESAIQTAYLVGVSDPSSTAGKPGLIDNSKFEFAQKGIIDGCNAVMNPNADRADVLNAATEIAKHASYLCKQSQLASQKTNNAATRREFIESARDVAACTSDLVMSMKNEDPEVLLSNRSMFQEGSLKLQKSVNNLVVLANSPELRGVPAEISESGYKTLQPILECSESILNNSCEFLKSTKQLAVNPKDDNHWSVLGESRDIIDKTIDNLIAQIKGLTPGQRECIEAQNHLGQVVQHMETAYNDLLHGKLEQITDKSLQEFNENNYKIGRALLENVEKMKIASKSEPMKLGQAVTQVECYFEPLMTSLLGTVSNLKNNEHQKNLIQSFLKMCRAGDGFMEASKQSLGNINAPKKIHDKVDNTANELTAELNKMLSSIEEIASDAVMMSRILESVSSAVICIDDLDVSSENEAVTFVNCQSSIISLTKDVARLVQDFITEVNKEEGETMKAGTNLSEAYISLAKVSGTAIKLSSNPSCASRLRTSVQDLGQLIMNLIKQGNIVHSDLEDQSNQRQLSNCSKDINHKISNVLSALKSESQGTQACINASSTISGIIGDLDTAMMFASAGTLNSEHPESFISYKEVILKTAKKLIENSKALLNSTSLTQEELETAANISVEDITLLTDVVKTGATYLGSNESEAQVMLINAVKDVAFSLNDLLQAAKKASGKPNNDSAISEIKEATQIMISNVTSFLKTVKSVEDKQTRGTRALETTVESIAQEIRSFDMNVEPKMKSSPEELLRITSSITSVTGKAMKACNSLQQDDVITVANMARKAVSDMLICCKSAAYITNNLDVRTSVLLAGRNLGLQCQSLLHNLLIHVSQPTPQSKEEFTKIITDVPINVKNLVLAAQNLKGKLISFEWFIFQIKIIDSLQLFI